MSANHQLINQTSGKTEWYTTPWVVELARAVMGSIDLDPASCEKANNEIVKAERFLIAPAYTTVTGMLSEFPYRHYENWGGLSRKWWGNVFLNMPMQKPEARCIADCKKVTCIGKRDKRGELILKANGKPVNAGRGYHLQTNMPGTPHWVDRAVSEYLNGEVEQLCLIAFSSVNELWWKPLKNFIRCEFDGRINYLSPDTMKPVSGVTKGSSLVYMGEHLDKFNEVLSPYGDIMIRYN